MTSEHDVRHTPCMTEQRSSSVSTPTGASTSRRRRAWTVFAAVSLLALAACASAVSRNGDGMDVGLAVLGLLIVIGIAAGLLASILTPSGDRLSGGGHGSGAWWSGGSDGGGWSDGGGGGGGDGGGGC